MPSCSQGRCDGVGRTRRWLFKLYWATVRYDVKWIVRANDDGFLCVPNIMSMLELLPVVGSQIVFSMFVTSKTDARTCFANHVATLGKEVHPLSCWGKGWLGTKDGSYGSDGNFKLLSGEFFSATLEKATSH